MAGKDLIRATGTAVALQGLGAAAMVLLQLVLARVLGGEEFGLYTYVLTWALVLSIVANVGMDTSALRYVSAYHATGQWGVLRGFYRLSFLVVILASVLTAAAMTIVATAVYDVESPAIAGAFAVAALLIPLLAITNLLQSKLLGLKYTAAALIPDKLLRPVITGTLVGIAALAFGYSVDGTFGLMLTVIAAIATVAILVVLRWSLFPVEAGDATTAYLTKEWFGVAVSLFIVALAQIILARAGILFSGMLMGTTEAGQFSIAFILAGLVVFITSAANNAIAPKISALFEEQENRELQHMIATYTWAFSAAALLVSVILLVFAYDVLLAFGESFTTMVPVLRILIFGNLAVVFGGPVGFLLTMTGHQKSAAVATTAVAILYLVLNLILIPWFGLVGAAWSVTISLVVRTLSLSFMVWKTLSIKPAIVVPVWFGRS